MEFLATCQTRRTTAGEVNCFRRTTRVGECFDFSLFVLVVGLVVCGVVLPLMSVRVSLLGAAVLEEELVPKNVPFANERTKRKSGGSGGGGGGGDDDDDSKTFCCRLPERKEN